MHTPVTTALFGSYMSLLPVYHTMDILNDLCHGSYHTSWFSRACPLFQASELRPRGFFNFPKIVRDFGFSR